MEDNIALTDRNDLNYFLLVSIIDNTLNFEIFKNKERQAEAVLNIDDLLELKDYIKDFIKTHKNGK